MKNLMIAAAVAAALSQLPAAAQAASPNDLAEIREQLQGLMQRVDKLEQENQALKTENQQLKTQGDQLQAQSDYLKAETKGLRKENAQQSADADKVKGTDWASKVTVTGDLRYRYEAISDDTLNAAPPAGVATADRYRDRIRARLAVTAKATDNLTLGLGLTSAENQDPRSGNQSLTGVFNKKPIEIDLAYFDWKFASWGDLIGGKMKLPFVKGAQNLFWDNDITPEGVAFTFSRGIWFGSAYNFWLQEVSGAENTVTSDPMMHGAQLGLKLPIGSSTLTLAAHYYDLSAAQGRVAPAAPFYNANANNNTTIGTGATLALLNDYEVFDVMAQLDATLGTLPFQVWVEAAQNQDPSGFVPPANTVANDQDTAISAGFLLGRASNAKTWEFGAMYQKIEKDALFAQLIDSDFAGGFSDNEGYVVRAGFAPVRNWVLNATYFINQRNVERANGAGQTEVDYNRLQLDFNVKF
ncbi:MAG TPA: putative porin [Steroidobacteraceae bacterium]|nr:putative porin [Steroidobacteraceae bacterium]